ncbi:Uncharacterised protein (plasmid) [Tsukamurella tyrosinosolvens]|uniref:Uncharacterized protein n=1 Tax=Tsukamurella tyrosinosolvens TaxID=57704 RepID=A0A1H4I6N4_TSUTY|nr:hypothetical protein [Tsukamurella tyrosinosolvens]KXO92768.1 hypothetical protein AXK58_19420 [Tsukamurella tyrosinosolvens]SEB29623.1 hypothetical protein SAMN04489793_0037 [Tsukamurella tyrosinosolvens]VEH95861.1 Uncharacterised protein [Tsukamurella tyrosinosolvens]
MEDIGIIIGVALLVALFIFGGWWGDRDSKRRAALKPPVPTMTDRIVERARAITYEVFMPAVWPRIEEIHARPDVASMSDAQRTAITDSLIEQFYMPLLDETVTYRHWLWDAGRRDEATAPAPLAPPPPPEVLALAIAAGRSAA